MQQDLANWFPHVKVRNKSSPSWLKLWWVGHGNYGWWVSDSIHMGECKVLIPGIMVSYYFAGGEFNNYFLTRKKYWYCMI
jgi:hypothetical protein